MPNAKRTMIGSPTTPASSASHESAIVAPIPKALASFDQLPDSALVRRPVVSALFGVHPATIWRHVQAGTFPAPVKVGHATAWRVSDLRAKLAQVGA